MKDKVFFLICFLAIFCIFCYKFKQFSTIIEGARCDPSKPTVYPSKPSKRTCQKLSESQNDNNLQAFKRKLNNVQSNFNGTLKKFRNVYNKHKEMNGHIRETVKSLDCKEIDLTPTGLPIYFLNCEEPAESDDDEDEPPEVDIDAQKRGIIIPSNTQKRNIGGMAL